MKEDEATAVVFDDIRSFAITTASFRTALTQKQWKDIRHKYIEAAGDDDEDDE